MLVDDSTSAEDERTGAILLPFDRAVPAELEHVVARDLRVVGRVVARLAALVVMALGLPVRLDRQVAAAAARRPRQCGRCSTSSCRRRARSLLGGTSGPHCHASVPVAISFARAAFAL